MMTKQAKWIVIAVVGLALIAGVIFVGPQVSRLLAPPGRQCAEPMLTLGSLNYHIQTVARAASGAVELPAGKTDSAYWVEGTNINYVFGLSLDPNNQSLRDALKVGDPATIRWADCSTEEYAIQSVDVGEINTPTLFDQSASGLTVFAQTGSSTTGVLIKGQRPAAQVPETPVPTEVGAVQADISFLGNALSPDGKSVQITIVLTNTGTTPFSLTMNDISLTAENAAPLAPSSVTPSPPQEIKPGAGATFAITFPNPGVSTAVLKILTFSLDYYF